MDTFIQLLLTHPFQIFGAVACFIYFLRGKPWHGIYIFYAIGAVYLVVSVVGVDDFLAGVVTGVIANEVFRVVRNKLDKEKQKTNEA